MIFHKHVDLNPDARILVFGDVHGAYHLIEKARHDLGMDDEDVKIFLGDLTDRGDQNFKCVMAGMRGKNTYCIRGNHEDMMIRGMLEGDRRYYECWYMNGGSTVMDEVGEEGTTALATILEEAPVMLTVSHGDKLYGFVHAEYPSVVSHIPVWFLEQTVVSQKATDQVAEMMMWNRDLIDCIKEGVAIPPVLGVDAMFHGHTPVKQPVVVENRHYIDTGGIFNGNLTVAVLDPGKDIWVLFHPTRQITGGSMSISIEEEDQYCQKCGGMVDLENGLVKLTAPPIKQYYCKDCHAHVISVRGDTYTNVQSKSS